MRDATSDRCANAAQEMSQAAGAIAATTDKLDLRLIAGFGGVASFAAAIIVAGVMIRPPGASALPSFARQTGLHCAACHTAFPQLTPFGRRFKLGGYTLGGGMTLEQVPPLAVEVIPTFTHTQVNQDTPPVSWSHTNSAFSMVDKSTAASAPSSNVPIDDEELDAISIDDRKPFASCAA